MIGRERLVQSGWKEQKEKVIFSFFPECLPENIHMKRKHKHDSYLSDCSEFTYTCTHM